MDVAFAAVDNQNQTGENRNYKALKSIPNTTTK